MPQPRPELIVVSGIAQGQRAVLMDNVAFLGRSGECDMQINEPTISRKQVRFKLAPGGWILENISSAPIRVSGKKCKTGEKVFVETGDVLSLGANTRVLFVSPDADPEEALAQYRQANPIDQPLPEPLPPAEGDQAQALQEDAAAPTKPIPPPPPTAPLVAEPATAKADAREQPEFEEPELPLTAEDLLDAERKAKLKKYGIMFGIYVVVLVVGVVAISMMFDRGENKEPAGLPPHLSEAEITRVLEKWIEPLGDYPAMAQQHLEQARRLYVERRRKGNGYLCVQHYKLYLAYGGLAGSGTFGVEDEIHYDEVMAELIVDVSTSYDEAYKRRESGWWPEAKEAFQEVQLLVPIARDPQPDRDYENEIHANARDNIRYINVQLNKKRR